MNEHELAALLDDMRLNGQREPIWIFEGKVIDGRNRLRACQVLNLEPKFREWDGNGSLVAFVLSLNLHRRHLNESQRAMVAAQLKPSFEAEAKQRMLAGKELDPKAPGPEGQSRDHAGAALNVSPRSVERALKVFNGGSPELIAAVSNGKIKVRVAAELVRFPRQKQAEILAQGAGAIRAASTYWSRRVKQSKRKPPNESFNIGINRVHSEDNHYRMEVDHEYRLELTSMLEEHNDENLEKALRKGLFIVMKKPDVA
jgi:hypothetical protein